MWAIASSCSFCRLCTCPSFLSPGYSSVKRPPLWENVRRAPAPPFGSLTARSENLGPDAEKIASTVDCAYQGRTVSERGETASDADTSGFHRTIPVSIHASADAARLHSPTASRRFSRKLCSRRVAPERYITFALCAGVLEALPLTRVSRTPILLRPCSRTIPT